MKNPLKLLEVFPDLAERGRLRWIKDIHGEEIEKLKEELKTLAPQLWEKLLPYQRDDIAISLFAGQQTRIIFAHDMGLGKTLMAALTAALKIKRDKLRGNVLVIAPTTSGQFLNFEKELKKWGFKAVQLEGPLELNRYLEDPNWWENRTPTFFIIPETKAKMTTGIKVAYARRSDKDFSHKLYKIEEHLYWMTNKKEKEPPLSKEEREIEKKLLSTSNDPERAHRIVADYYFRAMQKICPSCGAPVSELKGTKPKCKVCGAPLWTTHWGHKKPRWPIHKIIKRRGKGFFSFLIVDEVHEEKKESSSRGTVVAALSAMIPNVIFLTGTPFQGKASQLFYILGRIYRWRKGIFPFGHDDIKNFISKYGVLEVKVRKEEASSQNYYGWRSSNQARVKEAPGIANKNLWLLMNPIMIRRKKTVELADKLQAMKEQSVKVPFCKEHLAFYRAAMIEAEEYKKDRNYSKAYWTLMRAANLPPATALDEKLEPYGITNKDKTLLNLLHRLVREEDRKVIVFTGLTDRIPVIDKLYRMIKEAGFRVELWPAGLSNKEKFRRTSEFAKNLSQVAVASLGGYNVGLNLVGASATIFYEPYPRPEYYKQAKDRIWRIGQTRDTAAYLLFMEASVEEYTWQLLTKKIDTMTKFIDGELPPQTLIEIIEELNKEIVKEAIENTFSNYQKLLASAPQKVQVINLREEREKKEEPVLIEIPAGNFYQPSLF